MAAAPILTAAVENPVNMQLVNVESTQGGLGPVIIDFTLDTDSVKTASFDFVGQAEDTFGSGATCIVTRTFNVELDAVTVSLRQTEKLPLETRQNPEIVVLGSKERDVELQARTAFDGPREVEWTVTGGTILDPDARPGPPKSTRSVGEAADPEHVVWRLPNQPGMYQIEVLMDYGSQGIGFDVLRLEVSSDK